MEKHLGSPPRKILGNIFEVDLRRPQTNGPENNKTNKALHPRDNVDGLYVLRKEGGRGLSSFEDSVDTLIQWLEDFIKKARRKTDHSHQKQYWRHND